MSADPLNSGDLEPQRKSRHACIVSVFIKSFLITLSAKLEAIV